MPNKRYFQINFACGCSRVEKASGRCTNDDRHDVGCYTPVCEVHQKPSHYMGLEYDGDPSEMPIYELNKNAFKKAHMTPPLWELEGIRLTDLFPNGMLLPFCDIPLRDSRDVGVSFDY